MTNSQTPVIRTLETAIKTLKKELKKEPISPDRITSLSKAIEALSRISPPGRL